MDTSDKLRRPTTLAICRGEGKLFAALIAMTVITNHNLWLVKVSKIIGE